MILTGTNYIYKITSNSWKLKFDIYNLTVMFELLLLFK